MAWESSTAALLRLPADIRQVRPRRARQIHRHMTPAASATATEDAPRAMEEASARTAMEIKFAPRVAARENALIATEPAGNKKYFALANVFREKMRTFAV